MESGKRERVGRAFRTGGEAAKASRVLVRQTRRPCRHAFTALELELLYAAAAVSMIDRDRYSQRFIDTAAPAIVLDTKLARRRRRRTHTDGAF
jgi:hypothetical protein